MFWYSTPHTSRMKTFGPFGPDENSGWCQTAIAHGFLCPCSSVRTNSNCGEPDPVGTLESSISTSQSPARNE